MGAYLKTTGLIQLGVLFKKKNEDIYCVGSKNSDKYLYAPLNEANIIYFILHEVDCGKSKVQIRQLLKSKYGILPQEMDSIVRKCKKYGLIKVEAGDKIEKEIDEYELMMVNLKDFSLRGLYPFFSFLKKYMCFLELMLAIVIIIGGLSLITTSKLHSFPWRDVFSNPQALIYMWIIQFLSLVLHEFSHAAVGFKYGARPKSFSIAIFYYCMLIFYIRLPGIYFQEEKERIKIWIAGVYMNLFLASCSWILYTKSSGNFKLFFAVGVISNIMLVINNILPFFYSDGYYVLATLLKTPNLRKRSLFQFKKLIKSGLSKETMTYWVYFIIMIFVSVFVLGGQLLVIGGSIYDSVLTGQGLGNILKNYSNLLIIMSVGILGKTIGSIKKRITNKGR